MIGDYLQNYEMNEVGAYVRELKCQFYYHEVVRRAILMGMEKVNTFNQLTIIGLRGNRGSAETNSIFAFKI